MTEAATIPDALIATVEAARQNLPATVRAMRERMAEIGHDESQSKDDRIRALRLAVQLGDREMRLLGAGTLQGEFEIALSLIEAVDVLTPP